MNQNIGNNNCVIIPNKEYKELKNKIYSLQEQLENNNIKIKIISEISGRYYGNSSTELEELDVAVIDGNVSLSKNIKDIIYNIGTKLKKEMTVYVNKANEDTREKYEKRLDRYNNLPWYKKIFTFNV